MNYMVPLLIALERSHCTVKFVLTSRITSIINVAMIQRGYLATATLLLISNGPTNEILLTLTRYQLLA